MLLLTHQSDENLGRLQKAACCLLMMLQFLTCVQPTFFVFISFISRLSPIITDHLLMFLFFAY